MTCAGFVHADVDEVSGICHACGYRVHARRDKQTIIERLRRTPEPQTDTDALIERVAQELATLTLALHNEHAIHHVLPVDVVPPSEASERIGLLIYAFSLLRCASCSRFADAGAGRCRACQP